MSGAILRALALGGAVAYVLASLNLAHLLATLEQVLP